MSTRIKTICLQLILLTLTWLFKGEASVESNYDSKLMIIAEQAHVLARFSYRVGSDEASSYRTEEFVDRNGLRSTLKVKRADSSSPDYYFNNMFMEERTSASRRIIKYNREGNNCSRNQMSEFEFEQFRLMSIWLTPEPSHKDNDVAIGPSALLYLIQSRADCFIFEQRFILKGFIEDMYSCSVSESSGTKYQIKINVDGKSSPNEPKVNSKLTERASPVEVLIVLASIRGPNQWIFQSRISIIRNELLTMSVLSHMDDDDDIETMANSFDLERNPFLLPIGIGCFDSEKWPDIKRLHLPQATRFSARLRSDWLGDAYLAYDQGLDSLRYDAADLKNIYDLKRRYSYHTTEHLAIIESEKNNIVDGTNKAQSEFQRSTDCAVLDSFRSNSGYVWQLDPLGFGGAIERGDRSAPGLMGSVMIDNVNYIVYERKLDVNQDNGMVQMPLPLSSSFTQVSKSKLKMDTYYLTYYFLESLNLEDEKKQTRIMEPQIIEVWRYDPELKQKFLLNKVDIMEFSWNLDVDPIEEHEQHNQLEATSNPFYNEACASQHGRKLELRFILVPSGTDRMPKVADLISALSRNQELLLDRVQRRVCDVLQVGPVGISKFQMTPTRNSANVRFQLELVELELPSIASVERGPVDMQRLPENPVEQISKVNSIEGCAAEASFRGGAKLSAVYCSIYRVCLLYSVDKLAQLDKALLAPADLDSPILDSQICTLLQFLNYARSGTIDKNRIFETESGIAPTLQFDPLEIELQLEGREKLTYLTKIAHIAAKSSSTPRSDDSPTNGLRFMTTFEESSNPPHSNQKVADPTNTLIVLSSPEVADALEECRQACQMDRLCSSFSFCSPASYGQNRCVLSELRLSGDRLDQLRKQVHDLKQDNFQLSLIMSDNSSTRPIGIKKDESCSIYKKDILASFNRHPIHLTKKGQSANSQTNEQAAYQTSDLVKALTTSTATECAEMAIELRATSGDPDPRLVSFIYCSLSLRCELEADNVKYDQLRMENVAHACMRYSLDQRFLFDVNVSSHLHSSSIEGKDLSDPTIGEQANEYAIMLQGLDAARCARDCSLIGSDCLAFDHCNSKDKDRTICYLYNVRSPEATYTTALLPHEEKFNQQFKQQLVVNPDCSHFRLKPVPFKVKVTQMKSPFRSLQLKQRESELIEAEVGWTKRIMVNNQVELNSLEKSNTGEGGGGGLLINWIIFVACMGMSSVVIVYQVQIVTLAMNSGDYIRTIVSNPNPWLQFNTVS